MVKVEKFEDSIAWQKCRVLVCDVYRATNSRSFPRDFVLTDQIKRAAISALGSIASGFDRGRSQAFLVAKGMVAELRSHLHVSMDIGYLSKVEFLELDEKAIEVARIVAGMEAASGQGRTGTQESLIGLPEGRP